MQNEVYGFSTDVNGAVYYDDYPELFLANEKMSERQDLVTSEMSRQVVANSKLIEARINQKMTDRLAQANFQRPPAQTQTYTTQNTFGIAGLDEHGRPQYDFDPPVTQGRGRRRIKL